MKFGEKIQILRKNQGYSQEELAQICNVSRQTVSKWESDNTYPEIEKIILLSKIFKTPVDILLKDDLSLNKIKNVNHCGGNIMEEKSTSVFEGILIKESIADENLLDYLSVNKVELWHTNDKPKYWTVLFFTSSTQNLPELISKAIRSDNANENWFVDFKSENIKYIVFKNKILKYTIGNIEEKNRVLNECRKSGIKEEQLQWAE